MYLENISKSLLQSQNFFEQTRHCKWYSLLREGEHFYYKHQDKPCMAMSLQLE